MNTLLVVGITLLLGVVSSLLFKKLRAPQVIGHILIGILLGISGFQLFTADTLVQFGRLSELALGIIGFIIGGELRWARLKKVGVQILTITFFESTLSSLFVFCAVYLLTRHLPLSLIVGALASATAPGGTTNVIQEYRTRGPVTNTLFGVVGADDALAIMIYTIGYNLAKGLLSSTSGFNTSALIHTVCFDILGSLLLGALLGLSFILGMRFFRHEDGKQLYTIAGIFIGCGAAIYFGFSLILTTMTMGIMIGNFRPRRSRSYFLSIASITPPIYILFFVLVGARLDLRLLSAMGLIGLIYILFRTTGKISGAWLGGQLSGAPATVKKYLGMCLLSQAGVALGLALSAQNDLASLATTLPPGALSYRGLEMGTLVINVITATTLVFQIFGPLFAKIGLEKAGEIRLPR